MIQNKKQLIMNGSTEVFQQKRKDILTMFEAALEAVNPSTAVSQMFSNKTIKYEDKSINLDDFKNIYVVGFGKASVGMAQALFEIVSVSQAVLITNDPAAKLAYENVEIIVGGHPLPTQESVRGAKKILDIVDKCSEDDILIVLISGGGSALFCYPRVSLQDMQQTTDVLMKAGADINELNTVRKHLSYVKGGRLATKTKATIVSLIISDIIDDPLEFIASGPTVADSTTFADALQIIHNYDLENKIPTQVLDTLLKGKQGHIQETPKENDSCFTKVHNSIIASNKQACVQAAKIATKLGYEAQVHSTMVHGEAKILGPKLVDLAHSSAANKKCVLISGGEPTVTIHGTGKGGRNQELILSMIPALHKTTIVAASFGTDGIDGNSDAAGAIADGATLTKAIEKKMDYEVFLKNNNSYEYFHALHDVIITGPTGTNVMDIQIVIP